MRTQSIITIGQLGAIGAMCWLLSGCPAAVVAGGAAGAVSIATDPRTAGTIIEDQSIEFRVSNALQSDSEIANNAHVSVTAYNGIVLLTGEAPTAALRDRAEKYAKDDAKARQVHNEVTIEPPLPLKARNYDSWLTSKVKTKLLGMKDLNAVAIKLTTSNQTVYLLGMVKRADAQLAAQATSEVEGVTRVVRAFEYLD